MSDLTYTGIMMNYRLGRKIQYSNKSIIKILNLEGKKSYKLIGWNVCWPFDSPKIYGKIISPHGRKGFLTAKFKKGLPGQAMGTKVLIKK